MPRPLPSVWRVLPVIDEDQQARRGAADNMRVGGPLGETGMEFHIKTRGVKPDLVAINDALMEIDPTAVADIDPAGENLRVAVAMSSVELLALLTRTGYPTDWGQLEQVPPVCCGGCGG